MLLDGKQVNDFTFSNGVFKTTSPIAWTTPTGETASVLLNLHFSAFSGECLFGVDYLYMPGLQLLMSQGYDLPASPSTR